MLHRGVSALKYDTATLLLQVDRTDTDPCWAGHQRYLVGALLRATVLHVETWTGSLAKGQPKALKSR